jgi:hypothetical protein
MRSHDYVSRTTIFVAFIPDHECAPTLRLYVSIAVIFFRLNLIGTLGGVVLIQLLNTLLLMIWIPTSAFQGVDRALEEPPSTSAHRACVSSCRSRCRRYFRTGSSTLADDGRNIL